MALNAGKKTKIPPALEKTNPFRAIKNMAQKGKIGLRKWYFRG